MNRWNACARVAAGLLSLYLAVPAGGGSHLWEFSELFSNEDGTIQFIELHVPVDADMEIGLLGKKIISASTGEQFTFTENLTPPTGFKWLLLATEDFAAMPGAPVPDYIIPAGFFDPKGDTLTYHVYDTWTFASGQVPMDCINSLSRDGSTGPNSPTNYDDQTGSVSGCPLTGDIAPPGGDGIVGAADLAELLAQWGQCPPPEKGSCAADIAPQPDGDGAVGPEDLAELLANWS